MLRKNFPRNVFAVDLEISTELICYAPLNLESTYHKANGSMKILSVFSDHSLARPKKKKNQK